MLLLDALQMVVELVCDDGAWGSLEMLIAQEGYNLTGRALGWLH